MNVKKEKEKVVWHDPERRKSSSRARKFFFVYVFAMFDDE